ncbi:protein S40-4-like [Silene latifolia]|uniref:protein S40-4-like n=1 Tax=Silene latifolia TaxID=37657 RepID=UPI003D784A21
MANAKSYMMARCATATNYRFLSPDTTAVKTSHVRGHSFDFDDSDLWTGSTNSPPPALRQSRKPITPPQWKYSGTGTVAGEFTAPASAPMNVPNWNSAGRFSGEFSGGDDGEWVPPHEYLARTRNASFSMQEGIGRTLKGRDLSRVRNAIWEKTGFQD